MKHYDDPLYDIVLATFSHKELAGMYCLCNKREYDLQEKIKKLKKAFTLMATNGGSVSCLTLEQFNEIMNNKE